MCEHWCFRFLWNAEKIVRCDVLLWIPEPKHVGRYTLGQVPWGQQHVASPHVCNVSVVCGDLLIRKDVNLWLRCVAQTNQVLLRSGDDCCVASVHIGDACLKQRKADGVAVRIGYGEAALVCRVPHAVVTLRDEVCRIYFVGSVTNAVAINKLRNCVLRATVVVRVLQTRNEVAEVIDVCLVQRLQQVGCNEAGKCGVGHADDQVRLECATAQFCNCRVFVVVNALFNGYAESLFKIGNYFWVRVVGPVEYLNGAAFLGQAVGNCFTRKWKCYRRSRRANDKTSTRSC